MFQLRNKIYVITDEKLLTRKNFLSRVRESLAAGAGIIQLREKATILRDRADLARELAELTHQYGAKLVINDDPALALEIGADGVHLGQDDASVEEARALLGPEAIIGVSCYGDIQRALEMEKKGASYVSFGAFYPSPTKPKEAIVPVSVLSEAKAKLHVPVVAIGGITAENAQPLVEAGADYLAVISSIFNKKKTLSNVQEFKRRVK